MSTHLTTQELDAARAKYRGEIIPAGALSVMDAETEALRASGIERRALKPGAVAPDFMLPDAQGRCVRLQSLLRQGPVVLVFYRGGWCPYCNLGGEERDWVPQSEGLHFLGGKPITQFWLTVFQENKTNQTL